MIEYIKNIFKEQDVGLGDEYYRSREAVHSALDELIDACDAIINKKEIDREN